eukprot:gene12659-26071_t
MVDAAHMLRVQVQEMERLQDDRSNVRAHVPYLILFTDGTDQAGWMSQEQAIRTLSDAHTDPHFLLSTYSVGLQGET